ncbi:cell envelope integrity protein TolA [Neptunicella marina]|uniref:Cell envelope integrity protein TolA n=1 Tax=Neptunicella marina TaxID=2125989 RepID=A0A8J6IS41_9ALTE|nr:cell envelope integrity protein TolA [Neptunicella marina]MBC3764712.1 cell envelope integrity protein TolA [Neptunicella marina]
MSALSGSIWKSALLHVVIVTLLMLSVDISSTPQKPAELSMPIVKAVVVDAKTVEQQRQKREDVKREAREEAQRKVQEAERRRVAEQKRKERIAAQAKEKKRKEKEAAEKRERERQEKIKRDKEEARKAKELEEKKKREKAEAERKRKAAEEQARQEKIMAEQLQAEMAARQRARSQQVLSEVEKYKSLIYTTIQRNLLVDDSMNGKKCRLNIRLATTGFVTSVQVLGGDPIVCEAARRAVLKSETLPVSSEPDIYEQLRNINLTVEPEL